MCLVFVFLCVFFVLYWFVYVNIMFCMCVWFVSGVMVPPWDFWEYWEGCVLFIFQGMYTGIGVGYYEGVQPIPTTNYFIWISEQYLEYDALLWVSYQS